MGTLGRRIQEGQQDVRILGEPHHDRAEVHTIDGYSAHAGRDELRRWVASSAARSSAPSACTASRNR